VLQAGTHPGYQRGARLRPNLSPCPRRCAWTPSAGAARSDRRRGVPARRLQRLALPEQRRLPFTQRQGHRPQDPEPGPLQQPI